MSQRGRPSSAQTRCDEQRMPFAAAEALLWGRKTHDEHKFLFPRMAELEEQHKAYDTRIAATEVIVEAAEAATARIRRIEQQVAAIESDEQDRPFDRWAEREVTSFKSFMEKNKTVRQKQIELETKVLSLEDSADKTKDTSRDIETLLHRIERLENDRVQDANLIKRLEKNMDDIVSMSQNQIGGNNQQSIERSPGFYLDQAFQELPQRRDPEPFYATDETEDEEALPPPRTGQYPSKLAQGNRNPQIILKSTSTVVPSSPLKDRDHMSARMRVMQRKSIYDSKQPRENAQLQTEALAPQPKSPSRPRIHDSPATQALSRSNAEKPTDARESFAHTQDNLVRKQLIVKLNTRKRKIEDIVPVPRLTRSQARKNNEASQVQPKAPAPKTMISTMETQIVSKPALKRRKLDSTRASPRTRTKANLGLTKPAHVTVKSVKSSIDQTVLATNRGVMQSTTLASSSKSPKVTHHKELEPRVPRTGGRKKDSTPSMASLQTKNPVKDLDIPHSAAKPSISRHRPAASRSSLRSPLTMLVTPDRATLKEMEKNNPLLF